LTDESTNYIALDYNSGTPQFIIGITNTANGHTIFNLGKVYREGTSLDIIDAGLRIYDLSKRIQQHHLEENNLHFVSGAIVSETGTRNIAVSAGIMYAGLNRIATDAIDTSGTDDFEYYYYNGSSWIESDETQISNTQYNNTTTGLATLANNRYGVHWIYKGTSSSTYVLYGQDSYTLTSAQAIQPPSSLPAHVSGFGVLRAKIIIAKNGSTFTEIESVQDTSFQSSTPSNHNELGLIQGGSADDYYHFTNTQHTDLTDGGDSTLHYHKSDIEFTDTYNFANLDYEYARDYGTSYSSRARFKTRDLAKFKLVGVTIKLLTNAYPVTSYILLDDDNDGTTYFEQEFDSIAGDQVVTLDVDQAMPTTGYVDLKLNTATTSGYTVNYYLITFTYEEA